MPYTYNVNNSTTLTHNLVKLTILPQYRCITLVKDLCVNIPIKGTINITNKYLTRNNVDKHTLKQCNNLLEVIMNNNYFTYENKYYTNKTRIAMGSPISSTMAEIFLQHCEHTHIKHLLEKQTITFYNRYVDDIFIIYDSNNISINEIQQQTKRIHKNLEFKLTTENNSNIEYLDLLITRLHRKIDIYIFRKPTTTDINIHST